MAGISTLKTDLPSARQNIEFKANRVILCAIPTLLCLGSCGAGSNKGALTALEGHVSLAFKSGFQQKELLWVLTDSGQFVQVSSPPKSELDDIVGSSTGGYREGFGRFGPLSFDSSGRYLFFHEREGLYPNRRWRLNWVDLRTGSTHTLTETTKVFSPGLNVPPDVVMFQDSLPLADSSRMSVWQFGEGGFRPVLESTPGSYSELTGMPDVIKFGDDYVIPTAAGAIATSAGKWRAYELGELYGPLLDVDSNAPGNLGCFVAKGSVNQTNNQGFLQSGAGPLTELSVGPYRNCFVWPDSLGVTLYGAGVFSHFDKFAKPVEAPLFSVNKKGRRYLVDGSALFVDSQRRRILRVAAGSTAVDAVEVINMDLTASRQECKITSLTGNDPDEDYFVVTTHCGCADCEDGETWGINLHAKTAELIHSAGADREYYVNQTITKGKESYTAVSTAFPSAGQIDALEGSLVHTSSAGVSTVQVPPVVAGTIHGLATPP